MSWPTKTSDFWQLQALHTAEFWGTEDLDHQLKVTLSCWGERNRWCDLWCRNRFKLWGLKHPKWWSKWGCNRDILGIYWGCNGWLVVSNMKFIFSISYMGQSTNHWRTPSFFKIVKTANQNGIRTEYNRNTDNPLVVKKIGSQWEMNSKWDILSRVWLREDHIKIAGRCW